MTTKQNSTASLNIPINGPILQQKANELSEGLY